MIAYLSAKDNSLEPCPLFRYKTCVALTRENLTKEIRLRIFRRPNSLLFTQDHLRGLYNQELQPVHVCASWFRFVIYTCDISVIQQYQFGAKSISFQTTEHFTLPTSPLTPTNPSPSFSYKRQKN